MERIAFNVSSSNILSIFDISDSSKDFSSGVKNKAEIDTFKTLDIFSMSAPEINKYSKSYEKDLSENPDNAELNNSLAMCYLKLGFYDKAFEKLDKAIEQDFNNWETYLYAAVCLLKGNKPFVTPRADIVRIEQHINAGLLVQENGLLRYFQAYIKYDYFKRKFLKTSPTWEESLNQAKIDEFSPADVNQLFYLLKQEIPSVL